MSKFIDLRGQQFGKLTAIHPVGKNACAQTLWECVCECGRTTVTSVSYLRNGHTRSCGCLVNVVRDLTGQKFGKLTAIRHVPRDDTVKTVKRSALWLCKCECGREKVVMSNTLLTKNAQSCADCSWGHYEFSGGHVVGHFENGHSFLIDYGDFDMVRQHRWWVDKGSGYFCTSINRRIAYLHRLLMPDIEGLVCDHCNRDKFDNRRANLRYATPQQNSQNRSIGRGNTSGYIGVSWHIRQKKYLAMIGVNNKTINLGSFATAEEAARARDKAALLYFGSFANLNFKEDYAHEDASARESLHAAQLSI